VELAKVTFNRPHLPQVAQMLSKFCIIFLFFIYVFGVPFYPISDYNLQWETPSTNSSGSMPLGIYSICFLLIDDKGNGEVGLNLWVEESSGDVLFLISRTDTWDENGRLLKIGRIRIALDPNPFLDSKVLCFRIFVHLQGFHSSIRSAIFPHQHHSQVNTVL
jgi:hypothetical protein